MTNCKRALLGATILTSITMLSANSATAQDNNSTGTALGRIVLGAGADSTVAIDTPQAVTVINAEEIDREQATTVGELFEMVPGVQAIGSGRVAGESFNIRGIGTLGSSDESRIIITVDGAAKFYEQYRLGSFFSDPELYRQVEVLRGPASSTLYGSGALGGVINFETKDASDFLTDTDQAIRTRLSYGSNNDELAASVIFANRLMDNLEALVALNYREAGNYSDGDGNDVGGSEFDSLSGLIKTRLSFGNDMAQSLTASYTRWNSELDDTAYSQTGTLGFGTVDREVTDNTLAIRYQNPMLGNNLLDLDVVLIYSNTQVEQSDAQFSGGTCTTAGLFCDASYGYETTSLKVENTSEFISENSETFLTAGIQLSHQDRTAETPAGGLGFHPEGTDQRVGVYAQGEFILNDRLTIIPGIRTDFVSLEDGTGSSFDDHSEVAVSPKIAVHYEIDNTYSVFGSLAQTQRVPTMDEIFSFDADEPNSPDLTMETAHSAELGLSASYLDVAAHNDALDVKATLYYSEIDDLISRDSTAGTPYYENVDAAKIYGLEVEAAYQSDAFFARAAYSDVRGKDDATGETLSSIPGRSLNLTVGTQADDLGLQYGWQGNFVDDINYGATRYSGYAVHDLFVDWTPQQGVMQGITVGFRLNNVLDTQYENSLAGDAGQGRSFEVSLTRAFEF